MRESNLTPNQIEPNITLKKQFINPVLISSSTPLSLSLNSIDTYLFFSKFTEEKRKRNEKNI